MTSWEDVQHALAQSGRPGSSEDYSLTYLREAVQGIYELLRPPSERNRVDPQPGDYVMAFGDRQISVDFAARVLHEAYEKAAKANGWRTTTQVPWEDLPDANKDTMTDATEELLEWVRGALKL